jgi:ABC-type branched-subunit amino acid transport system substrate-binding protein
VVGIANGGDDAINAVKTAREFGITERQKVVPFGLDSLPAIHATSLQLAQGMIYVTPWLPGFDDAAKSFFGKFLERRRTAPSSFQVGTYSAVRSYLKAAEATIRTIRRPCSPKCARPRWTTLLRGAACYGPTAAWYTTSTWCRSRRRPNPRVNGIS